MNRRFNIHKTILTLKVVSLVSFFVQQLQNKMNKRGIYVFDVDELYIHNHLQLS